MRLALIACQPLCKYNDNSERDQRFHTIIIIVIVIIIITLESVFDVSLFTKLEHFLAITQRKMASNLSFL